MVGNGKDILFLDQSQVKSLIGQEKVLELVEESFVEYSLGNAVNPVKLHLPIYPDYNGYINTMPAYLRRLKIAGVKVVSVFSDNLQKFQLPSTIGTIILHDPETGMPYSIMDGTHITAMRTGAVMGVMAKYLAKPASKILTVVGAGAQGLSGFAMIQLALHSIEEVRVVDINPANKDHFIQAASLQFPDVSYVPYDDIQTAAKGSDLILAAASSKRPLFDDIEIDKGTTLLIIEGGTSSKLAKKCDKFIGDFKECLVERINASIQLRRDVTGEEELKPEAVTGEIGDVITKKISGRISDEEIILAPSVGMGIQDIIVAHEVYEKACAEKLGTVIPFL